VLTPRKTVDLPALKRRLGEIGVWTGRLAEASAETARDAARAIEDLGYGSLWLNESPGGKDPLTHSALLLAATERLVLATGIASIWARDATTATAAAGTLAEGWPGRFVLGLGVSHAPLVSARGHEYGKPLAAMRSYLDGMDAAPYDAPLPERPARLLAALRGRMLELARDRADGAHTYFVTPEHTAWARSILGPDKLLVPEQAVLLEPEPERARRTARAYVGIYLTLPNYLNSLRDAGWTDADFADGGTDRLIDAIVAWGDAQAIASRVRAHYDSGADHVCIQPLADTIDQTLEQLAELAPVLTRPAPAR
jgi:probable F420-dependent oxidoreductase